MSTDFLSDIIKFKQKDGVFYFFKRGGLFYAVGDDAKVIASRYLRSIGTLRSNDNNITYVSIKESLYISLIRDLLLYDRKSIELYEFEINSWSKAYEASPGNISSVIDLINNDLDISKTSLLLAVSGSEKNGAFEFNVACCDSTLFTIATTEFIDSSPSLVYYENLINQTMPSEIVFCDIGEPTITTLKKITDEYQIPYRETKVKSSSETGPNLPNTKSVKALLSNLTINVSEFTYKPFKLQEFMTIDHSASSALNVFPEGQVSRGLPTSIYQLLNECVTPMGSRLLHQYLQQPLLNKEKIDQRLSMVSALIMCPDVRMNVKDALKQVPDVARLTRKFLSGRANLQDCVRMHDVAKITPNIMEIQNANCQFFQEFVVELQNLSAQAQNVVELVEKVVDFKSIPQHIYRIAPEFNEELQQTSDDMDNVLSKMEKIRYRIADDIGVEQEKVKIERMPNQKRFYMRVSASLERNLKSNSEITITETQKDGIHFTTKKFNEFKEKYFELEAKYNQTQRSIAQKLYETLKGYAEMFQVLNDVFAQIDVFISLANVATSSNFVQPTLVQNGQELILRKARHPLVEKHTDFMPNDIEMNKKSTSFIIISGPNSAGKSTLLKTVGICVFLAHVGSFVPCDEATIPITASIHARVGAWDTPTRSTFTIEMEEMSGILQSAREESLIIVDELGRSTSCSDGFGLAWAISEKIAKDIKAFTLFATHFHELCNLENEIDCVTNFHMDVSVRERLLMRYQLCPGPFPTSFGIDAAERAGFPREVIENAKRKEVELQLADQKEGERPTKIVIDPNEPYLNFLRLMQTIDLSNCPPNDVFARINEGFTKFDEENSNRNIIPK
ncbi:MutS-like protein [Tritrichomonas musculus]|uniref:MutS-like protein n=1 Tax=Tritrichomonas musculus TaxID=1915356 RepID=A0ABR2JXS6_9EUKA